MKVTGIIRRIDDLGRVVIPKEIRRNMHIREGDALELYLTDKGQLVLERYYPYSEKDWNQAKRIVQAITNDPFALDNISADKMVANFKEAPESFPYDDFNKVENLYPIGTQWDIYGYLYTTSEKRDIIINILKVFWERE